MDPKELLKQAMALPADVRAALANDLLASLDATMDPEIAKAWATEIDRRIEGLDRGERKTVPWTEVRRKLFARE